MNAKQTETPTRIIPCSSCDGSGTLSQLDVDVFEHCGECALGEREVEAEVCDCCRKELHDDPAIGTSHYPTTCGCEDDRCPDCDLCSGHCGCDEDWFQTQAAEDYDDYADDAGAADREAA